MAKNRGRRNRKDLGQLRSDPSMDLDTDDIMVIPSQSKGILPTPPMIEMKDGSSPYFARNNASQAVQSHGTQPQTQNVTPETPGPGYATFSQDVSDAGPITSTPVNRNPANILHPSAIGSRRLEFGMNQAWESPALPPGSQRTESPASDLRIRPGESGLLTQNVLRFPLQPGTSITQRRAPRKQSPQMAYSQPSYYSPQNAYAGGPPQSQQAPPSQQFESRIFSSLAHPMTEEVIIEPPPRAGGPGKKQIRLKDNFTTAEFVDLLLHEKTVQWDILRDPTTGRSRAVFNQNFE